MQANLRDQVALVTGAARGIGKAIADLFAANGAHVVYTDVDEPVVRQSAAASANGEAMALDVTDAVQVESVVADIVRRHGRLDIAVNNAGVNTLAHRVPIDQFPQEEWERILHVDLHGVFLVSRAVAAVMRSQRSGRIINLASIAGIVPLRLQCPLIAAKAGVVNLTRGMALIAIFEEMKDASQVVELRGVESGADGDRTRNL